MVSIETARDGSRKMLREEADVNAALRILLARIKGQQTLLGKMEIAAAAEGPRRLRALLSHFLWMACVFSGVVDAARKKRGAKAIEYAAGECPRCADERRGVTSKKLHSCERARPRRR